jgi:hypothetical protein
VSIKTIFLMGLPNSLPSLIIKAVEILLRKAGLLGLQCFISRMKFKASQNFLP